MTVPLSAIEAHLRRAPYLHTYELGDLDPIEAPHTTWYASASADAVALVYRGLSVPTLIALADDDPRPLGDLLAGLRDLLPGSFYAHLTAGLEAALAPRFETELLGHHHKMALTRRVEPPDDPVDVLTAGDADEMIAFYAAAYPGSYFEAASLQRGPFVAVRDARGIAAIAGTHVYSRKVGVAALGSIATRPDARGRGLARRVTAALCHRMQDDIAIIGLNVRADNAAAIACYERVGFVCRHPYQEWRVTAA